MKGAKIDNDLAKEQLDKIKVVPNPYVVTHLVNRGYLVLKRAAEVKGK